MLLQAEGDHVQEGCRSPGCAMLRMLGFIAAIPDFEFVHWCSDCSRDLQAQASFGWLLAELWSSCLTNRSVWWRHAAEGNIALLAFLFVLLRSESSKTATWS